MLKLLRKIPVNNHSAVIGSMQGAAPIAAFFGLLMILAFSETTEEKCSGALLWKECSDVSVPMSERLTYLAAGVGLLVFALVCVVGSLQLMGVRGRLKKYDAILTGVESMSVMQIASIVRSSPDRVRDEIQLMIDAEMIDDVYIDYGRDLVITKKYVPASSYKTVVVCGKCHANNELIVGITKSCVFCREPLILNTTFD